MSNALHVSDLRVSLGAHEVLHGLALDLDPGRYGVVLGPSGSGKSTLLRAIAGLVPAEGTIRIGETTVCAGEQLTPPERRPLGFLFQGLALWNHLTVEAHLEFALEGRGVAGAERASRRDEILEALGLSRLGMRRPTALSGGERQRLALARALVVRPELLLLDEPTSSVDARLRSEIQELLFGLGERFGTTVLHVTHDQEEALALADRIFVLKEGEILQAGTPTEIYERPHHPDVARFVGEGGLLAATAREDGTAESPLGIVPVAEANGSGPVWLVCRPEHLGIVPEGEGVPAEVERASYVGGRWHVRVRAGDASLSLHLDHRPDPGTTLRIGVLSHLPVISDRRSS